MSPDIRKHRGAHPEDRHLFADDQLPKLKTAVADLCWLLSRDYALKGALKLVGDRFGLHERQRLAMSRAACSEQSRSRRAAAHLPIESIEAENLVIDGFNLIITIEAALSGGLLLRCRDDCIRDLSSIHGSYRSVEETETAIVMIGATLAAFKPGSARWLLDKPVSNSGRLAQTIRRIAAERVWDWSVDLKFNPDGEIADAQQIVITSDGPLLDKATRWTNLAAHVIKKNVADAWMIDLS